MTHPLETALAELAERAAALAPDRAARDALAVVVTQMEGAGGGSLGTTAQDPVPALLRRLDRAHAALARGAARGRPAPGGRTPDLEEVHRWASRLARPEQPGPHRGEAAPTTSARTLAPACPPTLGSDARPGGLLLTEVC